MAANSNNVKPHRLSISFFYSSVLILSANSSGKITVITSLWPFSNLVDITDPQWRNAQPWDNPDLNTKVFFSLHVGKEYRIKIIKMQLVKAR